MQGEEFEADLCLLKLGGCDMVLGVNWMREVNPIYFDFNKMEVTFEKGGKKMTLTGNMEAGTCKMSISCLRTNGRRWHNFSPYMPWNWKERQKEESRSC